MHTNVHPRISERSYEIEKWFASEWVTIIDDNYDPDASKLLPHTKNVLLTSISQRSYRDKKKAIRDIGAQNKTRFFGRNPKRMRLLLHVHWNIHSYTHTVIFVRESATREALYIVGDAIGTEHELWYKTRFQGITMKAVIKAMD